MAGANERRASAMANPTSKAAKLPLGHEAPSGPSAEDVACEIENACIVIELGDMATPKSEVSARLLFQLVVRKIQVYGDASAREHDKRRAVAEEKLASAEADVEAFRFAAEAAGDQVREDQRLLDKLRAELAAERAKAGELQRALEGLLAVLDDVQSELTIAVLHGASGTPERRKVNQARIEAARKLLAGEPKP